MKGRCGSCRFWTETCANCDNGTCRYYPQAIDKDHIEWCNRWEEIKPPLPESDEDLFCQHCSFYGPVYIRGKIVGYDCQALLGQEPDGCPVIASLTKAEDWPTGSYRLWQCHCGSLTSVFANCGYCNTKRPEDFCKYTSNIVEICSQRYLVWTKNVSTE